MERDLYGIPLEEIGLDTGTLTELRSMGINSVGDAVDLLLRDGGDVVNGTPDLEMLDLTSLEDQLIANGYMDSYGDLLDEDEVDSDEDFDLLT